MRVVNGIVVLDDGDQEILEHTANGKRLPKGRSIPVMIQWFDQAISEVRSLPQDGEAERLFRHLFLTRFRERLEAATHGGFEVPPCFDC